MQTKADTAPPPAARSGAAPGKSTLAADLRVTGDISCDGSIEVMGSVDGTLTARGLLVGNEGRVNGTVSAEIIEVRGRMDGRISCSSLTLRGSAQVTADVTYRTLIIESGAQIDGRFKHTKD
ncbi:polymer-forming cytoskeletal protein [Fertoebacter nigrum]|uniref:Polymer-forming cytoskeletal protein n=1 Tax=Fertoeibacter niger TaxID=2656921 RepID=A0A8X8HA52_9RHOB|nr:polymer-forming cytoskeletal protein [Fertoeibacter niger]NUB46546.1 polymer-forming cytoskeletal protein [Fertoeibacter niger]